MDRFWAKVRRPSAFECWQWIGYRNPRGYGQFHVPNTRNRPVNAHRVAYELCVGPIPKGEEVHHLCQNKGCVNPKHLKAVSRFAHPDSAPSKNRSKKSCPHGHPYSVKNTWYRSDGSRGCRACNRLRAQKRRDLAALKA